MLDLSLLNLPSPTQTLSSPFLDQHKVEIDIKRDDLIHAEISGNKWRKLKHNLIAAKENNFKTLLTFGGAYSNHIHATAAAGKYFSFKTIGIIRGEEYSPLNDTLQDAKDWGMQLEYINREHYKNKTNENFIERLKSKFDNFYLLPEGGKNLLAIRGCEEIIQETNNDYDFICAACGTGTTMAGLIAAANKDSHVLGFSVLKNASFLTHDISQLLKEYDKTRRHNWSVNLDYDFGGYAKSNHTLTNFIYAFEKQFDIPLEPVYTGKLFFGLFDLIQQGFFKPGARILAIHTGGLQGLRGFKK